MNKSGVIIQGSARSKGNTNKIVNYFAERTGFEVIDLKTLIIGQFDYDFDNQNDDFLPISRKIVERYQTIVFATPVYWYSMSGIMKVFFDRISDLLKIDKKTGRKFRGKNMALISCGSDSELKEGFTMPFIESANYLGMKYLGDVHTWVVGEEIPDPVKLELNNFSKKVISSIG